MRDSSTVIFVNGAVFTADAPRPWAQAVGVVGDRIRAVGTEATVFAECPDPVEVVDLAGRMLLPGFQDAHVHAVKGGMAMLECDLLPFSDREGAFEAIREYAAQQPPDGWVIGRGWAFEWFERGCPTAELLDSLTGGRAAYLEVRDGHSGWASTRALELAGVGASTQDPEDGRVERGPDGLPQGTLHEGAMRLVERVLPPHRPEDFDRGIAEGQRHLLALGITAWQDAWVEADYHAAYRRAAEAGTLQARVRGAIWWDRERGEEQVAEIEEMAREGVGPYQPGAVKLMLDGVCENFTASLSSNYEGHDHAGIDFIDPEQLPQIVRLLDSRGLQCHFHAIGDAAVRSALDAVETAVAANGHRDLRHTVAHLQLVHPEDIRRFHQLGVVPNCQALWACNEPAMTELTIPFLGQTRAEWQYPFASLAGSGAVLAMGSDWPVTTADVMRQIGVAVTRLPPGELGVEPFIPSERLRLGEALAAFTAGSAFVNHLDRDRGVVRPGNVADLVVLETDPFRVADPGDVRIDLTMVGGEVVFDRRER